MKQRHSEEFGKFDGLFFAFNTDQFKEGIEKIGLNEGEKVVSIGAGGYLKKSRVNDFNALMDKHKKERTALRKDKKKLIDALVYELDNHEFNYSGDPEDAVLAVGYTMDTIPNDILNKAIKQTRKVTYQ